MAQSLNFSNATRLASGRRREAAPAAAAAACPANDWELRGAEATCQKNIASLFVNINGG